jgi:hypothetical protein
MPPQFHDLLVVIGSPHHPLKWLPLSRQKFDENKTVLPEKHLSCCIDATFLWFRVRYNHQNLFVTGLFLEDCYATTTAAEGVPAGGFISAST